jgi:hypothetical protein
LEIWWLVEKPAEDLRVRKLERRVEELERRYHGKQRKTGRATYRSVRRRK